MDYAFINLNSVKSTAVKTISSYLFKTLTTGLNTVYALIWSVYQYAAIKYHKNFSNISAFHTMTYSTVGIIIFGHKLTSIVQVTSLCDVSLLDSPLLALTLSVCAKLLTTVIATSFPTESGNLSKTLLFPESESISLCRLAHSEYIFLHINEFNEINKLFDKKNDIQCTYYCKQTVAKFFKGGCLQAIHTYSMYTKNHVWCHIKLGQKFSACYDVTTNIYCCPIKLFFRLEILEI